MRATLRMLIVTAVLCAAASAQASTLLRFDGAVGAGGSAAASIGDRIEYAGWMRVGPGAPVPRPGGALRYTDVEGFSLELSGVGTFVAGDFSDGLFVTLSPTRLVIDAFTASATGFAKFMLDFTFAEAIDPSVLPVPGSLPPIVLARVLGDFDLDAGRLTLADPSFGGDPDLHRPAALVVVPEPASGTLAAFGFAGFARRRRACRLRPTR